MNLETILNSSKIFLVKNRSALIYLALLIITFFIAKPYLSIKPENDRTVSNFAKADYSSDKNWLGCRQHQHDCLYSALWKSKDAIIILHECGQEDACDELFGGK